MTRAERNNPHGAASDYLLLSGRFESGQSAISVVQSKSCGSSALGRRATSIAPAHGHKPNARSRGARRGPSRRSATRPRKSDLLRVKQRHQLHGAHQQPHFPQACTNSGSLPSLKVEPVLMPQFGISTQFLHSGDFGGETTQEHWSHKPIQTSIKNARGVAFSQRYGLFTTAIANSSYNCLGKPLQT